MLFKVGWNNGLRVSLLDVYEDTGLNKSVQKLVEVAKDNAANQISSKQTKALSRWAD